MFQLNIDDIDLLFDTCCENLALIPS